MIAGTRLGPSNPNWLHAANRLLVVDDNAQLLNLIASVAGRLGYAVVATATLTSRPELRRDPPTLVLLDLHISAEPYAASEIPRAVASMVPIVLMSGDAEENLRAAVVDARAHGATVVDTLVKPFGLPELRKLLLDHRRDDVPIAAPVQPSAAGTSVPQAPK